MPHQLPDEHDIILLRREPDPGKRKMLENDVAQYYKTFDPEGLLVDRRLHFERADRDTIIAPDPSQLMNIFDPNGLFANATSPTKPFIGIPGEGGILWSKGVDAIDEFYPDYSPPTPGSGSVQSPLPEIGIAGAVEADRPMFNSIEEAAVSQDMDRPLLYGIEKAALGLRYDIWDSPTRGRAPTPGPPISNPPASGPDLNARGDVIMASPVVLTDVAEDANLPPQTAIASSPTDYDYGDYVSTIPIPSSQLPNVLPHRNSNSRSSEWAMEDQTEGRSVADTSASDLGNSETVERKNVPSNVAMDSLENVVDEDNKEEGVKSSDKDEDAPSRQGAPFLAEPSRIITVPQASRLNLQRNTLSSRPISPLSLTPQPLQALLDLPHPAIEREALPSPEKGRSKEGRKGEKTAKRRKSGIIVKSDEELLEGFVVKERKELKGMKVNELRSLLTGIESLKRFSRVKKEAMVETYLEWQGRMNERVLHSSAPPPAPRD